MPIVRKEIKEGESVSCVIQYFEFWNVEQVARGVKVKRLCKKTYSVEKQALTVL